MEVDDTELKFMQKEFKVLNLVIKDYPKLLPMQP